MSSDTTKMETSQALRELTKSMEERRDRAIAQALNNPIFKPYFSGYEIHCKEMFRMDEWTITQAVNLLSGCHSERPLDYFVYSDDKDQFVANKRIEYFKKVAKNCIGKSLPITNSDRFLGFGEAKVEPVIFINWALSKDMSVPQELRKNIGTHPVDIISRHTTHLLEKMYEAIHEFWENHDPNKPPKKEVIIRWLMEEKGLSENEAKHIDAVIRPNDKKRGGNRKVAK